MSCTCRQWTLSIAVPGSVIDNTQTFEQATATAGQIARAAAIFNVDEVRQAVCQLSSLQGGDHPPTLSLPRASSPAASWTGSLPAELSTGAERNHTPTLSVFFYP